MCRVLIAYGTVEGHTARIAECMREELESHGHDVRLLQVGARPDSLPEDVDAIVVGGPVHKGRHQPELVDFAHRNRLRLAALPSGFFSVCLTAADDSAESRDASREYVQAFCDDSGWTPRHTAVFAGRLAWTQYDLFTRLIMKLITRQRGIDDQDVKRDYDYTDYDAVRRFAEQVAASVPTPA
jgi:menaquinone-dependent protoporphyrinogen oxidase